MICLLTSRRPIVQNPTLHPSCSDTKRAAARSQSHRGNNRSNRTLKDSQKFHCLGTKMGAEMSPVTMRAPTIMYMRSGSSRRMFSQNFLAQARRAIQLRTPARLNISRQIQRMSDIKAHLRIQLQKLACLDLGDSGGVDLSITKLKAEGAEQGNQI